MKDDRILDVANAVASLTYEEMLLVAEKIAENIVFDDFLQAHQDQDRVRKLLAEALNEFSQVVGG